MLDVEYPLEALRPGHSLVVLLRCLTSISCRVRPLPRMAGITEFAVRCGYAVESAQVYLGLRHQRHQLGNEIQWVENDVGDPIAVRRFELISDIA